MRPISILLLAALALRAQWPTRGVFANGSAYSHGVHYRFATAVEPPTSERNWSDRIGVGSASLATGNQEHRYFWDSTSRVYFGYDLAAGRADSSGSCRVTISPLSVALPDLPHPIPDAASYRSLSLPTYPLPQIVHPRDTIALDLLVSPDGKQKIVDYVQVSCEPSEDDASPKRAGTPGQFNMSSQPRDFSAQDLELRLVDPELQLNDRPIDSAGLRGESIGSVLWLTVPGKGRFLLSLFPYRFLGFRRAGTLRGNTISFQYGGDRYGVRSAEPIFRSSQAWNLYLRADESYPSNQVAAFGAADRPESILNGRYHRLGNSSTLASSISSE